eukprot:GHVU01129498.1.p1 GENE.GHVU01129498.1~~GHVU01129498.1.p1  ORF type:complete len:228 (-),score=20.59 GHVU01129498.1:184-867(-)
MYDITKASPITKAELHSDVAECVRACEDESKTLAASASRDGNICLIDRNDLRKPIATLRAPHGGLAIKSLTFVSETVLISGGSDCLVKQFDPRVLRSENNEDGSAPLPLLTYLGHTSPVSALAASDQGLLASGCEDGAVRIWEMGDHSSRSEREGTTATETEGKATAAVVAASAGKKAANALLGHKECCTALSWLDGTRRLLTCSFDQTSAVWDVEFGDGENEEKCG